MHWDQSDHEADPLGTITTDGEFDIVKAATLNQSQQDCASDLAQDWLHNPETNFGVIIQNYENVNGIELL